MMICQVGDEMAVQPCVEINFRRTMGHVALSLSRFVEVGKCGYFSIDYINGCQAMHEFKRKCKEQGFRVKEKRLTEGLFLLTPLVEGSCFVAKLEMIK